MNVSRQKTDRRLHSRLLAGFASKIQRFPALAGGTAALSVAMLLITLNAVWYQPAAHPSPILSTRAGNSNFTAGKGTFMTATRVQTVAQKHAADKKRAAVSNELTRDIQSALADKSLYNGTLDGIYGSKTKTAIIAYQKAKGLRADGEVTPKLLSHIMLSANATARVPVPKQQASLPGGAPHKGANGPDHALVSAIQSGLKNYGYDDIVIDGVMGSQTSKAIKRFELDYGMTITGEPSRTLLKKLKAIGATEKG